MCYFVLKPFTNSDKNILLKNFREIILNGFYYEYFLQLIKCINVVKICNFKRKWSKLGNYWHKI